MCYEAVNALLLSEFLKAHRKLEDQQATIAEQQKKIKRSPLPSKSRRHKFKR